jgi:hypothetical protein
VTFTNPANRFVGAFTGDGGGLTNLGGGGIQPGTVSSNALDAPTKAQLALAGTGGVADAAQISNVLSNHTLVVGTNNPYPNLIAASGWNNIVIGATNFPGLLGNGYAPQNAPGAGILLPDGGGLVWQSGSGIWNWASHGGGPTDELNVMGGWGGCIEAGVVGGNQGSYGTSGAHWGLGPGWQLGGSGPWHDCFYLQYDDNAWNTNYGRSKLLAFITVSANPTNFVNSTNYTSVAGVASLQAVANSYTSDQAMIRFHAGPWDARGNYPAAGSDGIDLGGTIGNGWEFRGRLIQEQGQISGTANCALDFGSAYCVTITPSASSLSFFTTNRTGATTNYEHRVFVIRSGTNAIATTWPPWTWFGSAPTNIGPAQVLRLSLESVGPGETNVLAWPLLGK